MPWVRGARTWACCKIASGRGPSAMTSGRIPRRLSLAVLGLAWCGMASAGSPPAPHSEIPITVSQGVGYSLFLDPDPYVNTKEFALYWNSVPDTLRGPGRRRSLFHLMYQRTS